MTIGIAQYKIVNLLWSFEAYIDYPLACNSRMEIEQVGERQRRHAILKEDATLSC